jgi:hypothetical protein
MIKTYLSCGIGIAALLSIGCQSDTRPGFEPGAIPQAGSSAAHAGAPVDVTGTWAWSSTELLTLPPFVAEFIFGIQPEGPVTQLRCDTSGTMTLDGDERTFSGSTTQAPTCRTGRGVVFVSPPAATPPALQVVDGSLNGHSIKFTLVDDEFTSCSFNGVITDFDQGVATGLRATGRCIIPGHPKSPAPLDPPPAGTSKTIQWTATRS